VNGSCRMGTTAGSRDSRSGVERFQYLCSTNTHRKPPGKGDVYMCRNIKKLRHPDHAPTDQELHDAALQFVRKISGFNAPSRANQDAFDAAVQVVAEAGRTLFRSLHIVHRPVAHADSEGSHH